MGGLKRIILLLCTIMTVEFARGQLSTPPSNTTALLGNQTTLTCRVSDTTAHFEWYEFVTSSNGKVFFSTPPATGPEDADLEISGTYDVIMRDLELQDGGQYGCKTFSMIAISVVSLVVLEPPSVMIPDLVENIPTPVMCSANYGGPHPDKLSASHKPTLRLYVDGQDQNLTPVLTPGHPPQDDATYEPSILNMGYNYTPMVEHNGREIVCEIVTTSPMMSLSMSTIIQVRYAVRNQVIYPIKTNYKINEIINCTADGHPTPDVFWTALESPYPHNPGTNVPILTILSNMVGFNVWRCTAQNDVQGVVFVEQEIEFTVDNQVVPGTDSATSLRHSVLVLVAAILWHVTS